MENKQTKQTFSNLLLLSFVITTCFMHVSPTFGCTVDSITLYTGRTSTSLSHADTFRIPKGGTVYYVARSTVTNPEYYSLFYRYNYDQNDSNSSWDYSETRSYYEGTPGESYLRSPESGTKQRTFNYVGASWTSVVECFFLDASGNQTGNAVSDGCAIQVVGVGSVSAGGKTSTPGDPNTLYIAKGETVDITAAATPAGSWPKDNSNDDTPVWYIDDVYQAGLDGHSTISVPINSVGTKQVRAECGNSYLTINIVGVGVDSVSAEGITSYTDTPGSAQTVYVGKGKTGDTITITAEPNPSGTWPDLKPTWEGANQAYEDEEEEIPIPGQATFPINTASTTVDGTTVIARCGELSAKAIKIVVVDMDIDAYVNGETARKIEDCNEVTGNASMDDDVRVITGGWLKYEADISPAITSGLTYKWTASSGTLDSTTTNPVVNWNAPTSYDTSNIKLDIKQDGRLVNSKTAVVTAVQPRIIRVKFEDDGSNNIITLIDAVSGTIVAPQYDRLNTTWETATGHEADQDAHKNDESTPKVFKNESVAYVKGGKMRVVADLAATDLSTGTPTELLDLSVNTPIKLTVVDAAPSLTFKNTDSGVDLGTAFDVQAWSTSDYSNKTRFTSNEVLGETGPKIRFYWESTLKWTIKVKDKSGNWVNSLGGTSTWDTVHRSLCVANAQPIQPLALPPYEAGLAGGGKALEKVMQYACDFAAGQGTNSAIVDALFNGMDTNDISSKGARLDHEYTFDNPCTPQTAQAFVKGKVVGSTRKMRGSCGHFSYFFAQLGEAHGIGVHINDFVMIYQAYNDATNFAVDVQDIDGDWREISYGSTGAPPDISGNRRWWWNPPAGSTSGIQHSVNEYGGNIYDVSLGLKGTNEDLGKYIANRATYYCIKTGASTWVWKAKGSLGSSDKIKWTKVVDDGTPGAMTTWPPFP